MPTKTQPRTFLVTRKQSYLKDFEALSPQIVSSAEKAWEWMAASDIDTLWLSYDEHLMDAALKKVWFHQKHPARSFGTLILFYIPHREDVPILTTSFKRTAFFTDDESLPREELGEVLAANNKDDLFIGGTVSKDTATITLRRGNLESLVVPFSAFKPSGDGVCPDFDHFSVTDYGQTIKLGDYEAASDAILYESDAEYRRRIAKERLASEKSFGASLRRLRKQRGLKRTDFSPLTDKTIARIEQGLVERPRGKTLSVIAERLDVEPGGIESY
ncbi:MAG TPA: helix-turn-helix transcriptional regulator [Pirellulales bacterium]